MTIDFNALRMRKGTNFDALQKTLEKSGGGGFKKDERIWTPTKIKGAQGTISSSIIRFLPISAADLQLVADGKFKEEDLTPLAKILKHQFQGPKGWFMENSLQTFGEACPIREYDMPQWVELKKLNLAKDAKHPKKEELKKRIPKTDYYCNILVIKDAGKPENNGKTFLFQPWETVKKMIEKANKPEFETDRAFDPFDIVEGAELILNLTYEMKSFGGKENEVPVFTNVKWGPIGPLANGDEAEQERIWRTEYSLLEFYDRSKFKTFDELKEKFCKVMGLDANYNPTGAGSTLGASAEDFIKDKPATAPAPAQQTATSVTQAAGVASAPAAAPTAPPPAEPESSGSDDLDEFERMLNSGT